MKKKVIFSVIAIALLAALILFAVTFFSRIDKVNVTGCEYYSSKEIEEKVFCEDSYYRPAVAFFRELAGKKEQIPFVADYSVSLDSLHEATIDVKMKPIVAYVEFMNSCLYFDMDGLVQESSTVRYPDIPQITGLDIDYVVLGRTLPVSSRTVLNQLLQVTQFLSSRNVLWGDGEKNLINIVERIHFDNSSQIWLYMGDVSVLLGTGSKLEGKLPVMADILPKLYGRSGTLHLENFDFSSNSQTYRFY